MKKYITLIVVSGLLFSGKVFSQNLVLNPGLDNYTTCPSFGQFSNIYIPDWDKPSWGSTDYYNYNCPGIQPSNQFPHSGEGYAGIIAYNFGTEYREYMTGTLSTPLVAGTVYDVEFYVSLHDGYIQAIEELGAYLSAAPPGPFGNALHISVIPQIENLTGALDDNLNWVKVYGSFTAAGGEQYITIGNFHDDAGTTITQPGSSGSFGAYYFIDDVSVTEMNATGVAGNSAESINLIYAGNGSIYLTGLPVNGIYTLTLLDVNGRKLFENNKITSGGNFQAGKLPSGIYYYILNGNDTSTASGKLFVSSDY
jgi:hypothetical protein